MHKKYQKILNRRYVQIGQTPSRSKHLNPALKSSARVSNRKHLLPPWKRKTSRLKQHENPSNRFRHNKLRENYGNCRPQRYFFRHMIGKVPIYCFYLLFILPRCAAPGRYCEEHRHSEFELFYTCWCCRTRTTRSQLDEVSLVVPIALPVTSHAFFMADSVQVEKYPKKNDDCPTFRREVFRGRAPWWKRQCRAKSQGNHE
jgi:hypothetical protein